MSDVRTGTEKQFLENYNVKEYPAFAVTVDIIVLACDGQDLKTLLIKRGGHPYKGSWALPGGFVNIDESTDNAAQRELMEETNLNLHPSHLEQLGTYSTPGRDPRMRVVSVAYIALLPSLPEVAGGDDATDAQWLNIHTVLAEHASGTNTLAFDHYQILTDALNRIQAKLEYTSLATRFLPDKFTLTELQSVYEAIWQTKLPSAGSFRRKVISTQGFVSATGEMKPLDIGRPAELYSTDINIMLLQPAMIRPA